MAVFRTEHAIVTWGKETTWASSVTTDNRFGLHEIVEAPDPEFDWYPFYGVASGRSRATILRGRQTLRGSVPDIKIQDDFPLQLMAFPIGRVSGSSILEGKTATDETLDSLTMQIAMRDTDGEYSFIRNYHGGKVNRASWRAEEGGELRYNLEEIIFRHLDQSRAGVAQYALGTLGTDPGFSGAPRYIFANATLTAFGLVMAHVRRFTLSVDNQIEPRYYLAVTGEPDIQQVSELHEGKRIYALEFEIDVLDGTTDLGLWDFMLNQGAVDATSPTLGGTLTLAFRSMAEEGGSSTLTFNCSGSVSAANPGAVIRSGRIGIPAPPTGTFPATWTMDVDTLSITRS